MKTKKTHVEEFEFVMTLKTWEFILHDLGFWSNDLAKASYLSCFLIISLAL